MLKKNLPVISKTLKYFFSITKQYNKKIYGFYSLKFVGEMLLKFKNIILPKFLLDELILVFNGASYEQHIKQIIFYVGIIVAIELICKLTMEYAQLNINMSAEFMRKHTNEIMAEKCMTMDFEQTEDPQALDQVRKAKEGMDWYSGGVIGVLDCVYSIVLNIISFVGVIAIIAIYCPLLLPLQIIVLLLVTYLVSKNNKIQIQFHMDLSKINRVFSYIMYSLTEFKYGKDIRMYDSVDMIDRKSKKYSNDTIDIVKKMIRKSMVNNNAIAVINCVRDGLSYLYIGILVIKKRITIGDFSMCASASGELFACLRNIVGGVQNIIKSCNYAHEFVALMEYPDAIVKGKEKVKNTKHIIEFKNVGFKYPRSEQYVLKNINIKISSGEHLSVVGLNGAGKTTFIKLLCRLYDVTEGEILIDGINIQKYSEEEYRKLFAVVFQDFRLYAFSLAENITFKENTQDESVREDIDECLRLSGMYDDAIKLENGMDTVLFKSFDEHGTELSGGQSQKVAISRALYKDSPIVILDEPTAALDPVAEYEIYRRFNDLVGGKTAIYISHRLSSCKFCDKIAVFAENTIKEYGTHEELITLNRGIYAEMFNQQAQYYINETSAY